MPAFVNSRCLVLSCLRPLTDDPSFSYEKLVRETWYKKLVRLSSYEFFSYEKLGWIRTLLYSVRETWSHVIEMLRRCWLEVLFVVVYNIFCCWMSEI